MSYRPSDFVRTVSKRGQIRFAGKQFYIGEAFAGRPVGLRPKRAESPEKAQNSDSSEQASSEPKWAVYYFHKNVRVIESKPPTQ